MKRAKRPLLTYILIYYPTLCSHRVSYKLTKKDKQHRKNTSVCENAPSVNTFKALYVKLQEESVSVREAAQKVLFFGGPATKAFTPPPPSA